MRVDTKVPSHSGFWKCRVIFLLLLTGAYNAAVAQTIAVLRANGSLANNQLVAFPAAAHGPSYIIFTIQNTGASTLNLTGSPLVQVLGVNAAEFVVTQPAVSSLAAGASTSFKVVYTPSLTTTATSSAQLRISSNSSTNNPFVVNLSGGGNLFYGCKWPPVDNGTYQLSTTSNEAGRAGGRTITVGLVSLSDKTTTYWGPAIDSSNTLQLKLSLDGNTFTGQEVFTYSPTESNLAGGIIVWRGQTRIANAITGTYSTVYTKATLTTRRPVSNAIVPLTNPVSLGLSEQVGGVVLLNSSADYVNANYYVEASLNSSSGFQPYLDFYDAYPTPPGPLPGSGVGAAYVTINNGTYWRNLSPKLATNQIFDLNEGAGKVISTSYLRATDDEDLNFNLVPEKIVFQFMSGTSNSSPMVYNHGDIKRNGITLAKTDSFTLKDLQDGIITYQHDGSETVYDEFQFSIKDSKKQLATDAGFTVFTFKINILPVNDLPVAQNATFSGSYTAPLNGTLTATDPDNTALTYSVVSAPASGNVILNPNGSFTYTPAGTATPGNVITFTFRVFDGTGYSNTATVTITLIDLPPTGMPATYRTLEDLAVNGTLQGTDPEGSAVTFQISKVPSKGSVTLGAAGNFTYQPSLTRFGNDYFIYKASDASANLSAGDTIHIDIMPRTDDGDLLIADKTKIHLYDPATFQDTVISRDGSLSGAQNIYYKKGSSVFVLDANTGLLKINPFTGAQSILAPNTSFSGGPGPLGIILHPTGGYLVIADGMNGIRRVDTTTGVVTNLFTGGSIQFATGVVYLDNGDLLVSDGGVFAGGTSKIIKITPGGTQSVLATGGLVALPVDLALIDQNTLVVSDGGAMVGGTDRVYKVDVTSGAQTAVSSSGQMNFPSGLDYDTRIGKLYVINQNNAKLIDVNPTSGVQTILPTPSYLTQPFGMMVIAPATKITSVTVPPDSTYITGQHLDFLVNYSTAVNVNTAPGTPVLSLIVGSTVVNAVYQSGSGTSSLLFRYTVSSGHLDLDGITLTALKMAMGISASGVTADSALYNVGSTTNVWVDGVAPTVISSVRFNPTSAVTNATTVVYRVTFSEPVKNISTTGFALSGTASGNIVSVSASTGSTVDVTVNVLSSPGTLRLDVTGSGLIKDLPGNPLASPFTGGEDYTINNAPSFISSASQAVCMNTALNISNGISASDADNGQTLTWNLIAPPTNGTVTGLPVSAPSTGSTVIPSSGSYQPSNGFSGTDAFTVEVSDGISSDTLNFTITVVKPVVDFSINTAIQCLGGNSFVFTNNSTVNSGTLSYNWDFNDGNTLVSTNATHSYSNEGNYLVKLKVISSDGCTDSLTKPVVVEPKPTPGFTINAATQCVNGNSFDFTNTSVVPAGIVNYLWNFDDGNTATSFNASHVFASSGVYNVKLIVITSAGCTDSITIPITVYPKPAASFTIANAGQCVNGNNFAFTNASTISSGTLSYEWQFGDGAQLTSADATHTYASAGNYTVRLIATSLNGCRDSMDLPVTVFPKPTPAFTINDSTQCRNQNNFTFTNTSAITSGTNTYSWFFGDGNGSSLANASHIFTTAGNYDVKLVVTSDLGCMDSVIQAVDVYADPAVLFTINNAAQCLNGNNFLFTNNSTVTPGTLSYAWDYGDGASSVAVSPVHTYLVSGPFNVKLIATSNNGCKDSLTLPLIIYPKPVAAFSIANNTQCVNGNNFSFTNSSSISPGSLTYAWSFGDGSNSTQANPTHIYAVAGNYFVKLVVTSDKGCQDSITLQVTVHPKPTPAFTINSSTQCVNGNNFQFSNMSSITSGSFTQEWFFGDAVTTSGYSPSHSYAVPGNYDVKLVINSDAGCKDSITFPVVVNFSPVAQFNVNTAGQCFSGNNYVFTNGSAIGSGSVTYEWSFGDGANASTLNASHSYAASGGFNVKLVTTSDLGCKDSMIIPVTVHPQPLVQFTVNSLNQCITANNFVFTNTTSTSIGQLTYTWDFGDGNGSVIESPSHSYLNPGIYFVSVNGVSDKGCTGTASGQVIVTPKPLAVFTVNDTVSCLDNNQFLFASPTPATPVNFGYYFGDGTSAFTQNPSKTYTSAGVYEVKFVTVTTSGCVSDTSSRILTVYPQPVADAGMDLTVLEGNTIALRPGTAVAGQTYRWTPSTYLITADTILKAVSAPVNDIAYSLTATGIGGCTSFDVVNVKVLKYPVVPTAFTPNGDGINDTWQVKYLSQYPGSGIQIFSRSGQLVFTGRENAKWDGKLNGSYLPVGTYYYIITPGYGRQPMSGSITIIR
jgi:gliding motility-associated-like protein